jgi:ribosome-binding factor A
MSSSRRLLRVRELLKREIGEVIRRELPTDKVGLITVSEIQISPDLHNAKVFVGVLGTDIQRRKAVKELARCRVRIQNAVGSGVALKHTPTLKFFTDDSIQESNRVLSIIEELDYISPPEKFEGDSEDDFEDDSEDYVEDDSEE